MYNKDRREYTLECESCGLRSTHYWMLYGWDKDGDMTWECKCGWRNTLKKEEREDDNYISMCNEVILAYPGRWIRCHECYKQIYVDRNKYSLTATGRYVHTCGFCCACIYIHLECVPMADMSNPIPLKTPPTITQEKKPILFNIPKRMPRIFRFAVYTIIILSAWKLYVNLENIFTYFFR